MCVEGYVGHRGVLGLSDECRDRFMELVRNPEKIRCTWTVADLQQVARFLVRDMRTCRYRLSPQRVFGPHGHGRLPGRRGVLG
jgi:hypothetical protein